MATDRHSMMEYMRTLLCDLPPVHAVYIPGDVLYSKSCKSVTLTQLCVQNIDCQNRLRCKIPSDSWRKLLAIFAHSTVFIVLLLCFSACRTSHRLYIKLQCLTSTSERLS